MSLVTPVTLPDWALVAPPVGAVTPTAPDPTPRPAPAAVESEGVGTPWEDAIEPPPPCPKCGSMELWQNPLGTWRCQRCDGKPFRRSLQLASLAKRIRRRTKCS